MTNMTGATGTPNEAPDPILDKVRKLLAKAEDSGCTPAESEAFTAKATELIAKYGIDRAMLAAADPTSDIPGDRIIYVDAPYARDKVQLLNNIAHALRCKSVQRKTINGMRVHVFGFASDLERVDLLYTSLLVQSAHALAVAEVPRYENTAAWRRSWMLGFSSAIYGRLIKAEQRAEQTADSAAGTSGSTGPSVALVLVDRSSAVERAMAEAYPKVKKARRRQLSGDGEFDGIRAGRRANLGGTGLGQSSQRALGGRA
jgi:hypothetical protein